MGQDSTFPIKWIKISMAWFMREERRSQVTTTPTKHSVKEAEDNALPRLLNVITMSASPLLICLKSTGMTSL